MSRPGTLVADYYITCALCEWGTHVGEHTASAAKRAARELGWQVVLNIGWCCGDCFQKHRQETLSRFMGANAEQPAPGG